jgi:hypothetical protein
MRTRTMAIAACVLLAFVVTRAAQSPSPGVGSSEGSWSQAIDGLRGRLILTAFLDGSHQQVRLDLEIENVRDTLGPIEIPWREPPSSIVQFSLEDQAGAPVVSDIIPGGNEFSTMPYVLALPMSSATRMTLSRGAYEYAPKDAILFRPFTFVGWRMTAAPAPLYLSAMLAPKRPDTADQTRRLWVGPLVLPRVALPPPGRRM